MADAFVILPDDSLNTGKKVRTQTRTVAGNEVHEHMFNLVDPLPTGTNSIGQVTANAGTDLNTSALALESSLSGFRDDFSAIIKNPGDPQSRIATVGGSDDPATGNVYPIPLTTGGVAVKVSGTVTSTPSGTQDVNLTKVNGTTISLGQVTMAASVPVVLASNQSSIPVAATLSAETTKVIGTVNQGTSPWVVSGTVTATPTGTYTVAGNKTNNNAAPGATNIGALIALANAAAPTWTEGDLVLASVDLAGGMRLAAETSKIIGTINVAASQTIAVTNTGTFAVQAALNAETTKVIGTVRVVGSLGNGMDSSTVAGTSPTNGLATLGVFNSTEPSPTNTQSVAIQLDSKGRQRMVIMDAAGNTRGVNVNSSNQMSVSVDNTVTVNSHAVTVASGGIASGAIASGAVASGAVASGAIASGAIAAGAIAAGATSIAENEDVASADADRLVKVAAIRDDTLDARSGTEGDYEQFHLTAAGALWVTPIPSTTGGWTTFLATSSDGSTALTNSAQAIKGSAGTLGGWYIYNPNTVAIYVHVYNVASGSVTVGTTNPQCTFCIPAGAAANVEFTCGINFATAMSTAATTTGGGNSAPSTALEAVFFYK